MIFLCLERPNNTLGKVLVEIRTLIQQAEEKARSPLNTPSNPAPFSLGFTAFSDLSSDEGTSDNLTTPDQEFGPRSPHYDTLSIDSSPMRSPSSHSPASPAVRNSPQSAGTDTSEFEEFLSKPRQFLEKDFSELTLTGKGTNDIDAYGKPATEIFFLFNCGHLLVIILLIEEKCQSKRKFALIHSIY